MYLARPVGRFQYLVGHNTFLGGKIFAFTVCLKHFFLGATKCGGHCHRMPPRGYGPVPSTCTSRDCSTIFLTLKSTVLNLFATGSHIQTYDFVREPH